MTFISFLTMFVSFIQQIVYTGLFCISQDFSQVTALLLLLLITKKEVGLYKIKMKIMKETLK